MTSIRDNAEPLADAAAAVVAVAPAADAVVAAVTASKRSAKKLKKAAAKSSDDGADDDLNANNIATVDHPYLSFLHKRIRSHKKKLEKIKTLETAQSVDRKVLNSQQLELVNSKSALEKIVAEFESLREQFIDVYLQEEAAKRAEQEKQAAEAAVAAASAAVAVETLVDVIVDETVAEIADQAAPSDAALVPPVDAFEYVRDLLKTLHVVNLHQALGKEIPMVLDFFSKVLLGNTRPVAEVAFDENLAESLDEAKKYLARSDKVMACDATYRDLRAIVDDLAQLNVLAEVVEPTDAAAAPVEALPEINFFTDSLLETDDAPPVETDVALDDRTDDKEDEHANAPEEIVADDDDDDAPALEPSEPALDAAAAPVAVETLAPSPASIPAPPMSFAAAAASTPPNAWASGPISAVREKAPPAPEDSKSSSSQRRRPQSGRAHRPNGESKSSDASGDKPRRSRSSNHSTSHSGAQQQAHYQRTSSGPKDDRRPRVDRALRKQGAPIHQPHAHASPQA